MHAKLLQLCLTLCDCMDCTSPGSSVHGILQARTLEWVACLPRGDLPDPGIEPISLISPALAGGFFTTSITWEAPNTQELCRIIYYHTELLLCRIWYLMNQFCLISKTLWYGNNLNVRICPGFSPCEDLILKTQSNGNCACIKTQPCPVSCCDHGLLSRLLYHLSPGFWVSDSWFLPLFTSCYLAVLFLIYCSPMIEFPWCNLCLP